MKILYICTHNRCRSILSEAITNHLAADVITAKSAGSQPTGVVHPLAITHLEQAGIACANLQSQSWHQLEYFAPDIVITVCDSAAAESCPVWFGSAIKVHWGLSDPSKLEGSEQQIAAAFRDCIADITTRVHQLKKLADMQLDTATLKLKLAELIRQKSL